MDIMTKVRVLWEKVAGITADVSAVDAKATATAATLAGILPRIPADYSTTETATGQKWIDGKNIYLKVFFGVFDEITTTSNQLIGSYSDTINLINAQSVIRPAGDNRDYANRFPIATGNGNIAMLNVQSSFSAGSYYVSLFYTKPNPVPAQADNETKKRKTKKEDK